MESILKILAEWSGNRTNWSRWAGSIIIATFLFVWGRQCVKVGWVEPGASIVAGIFGLFLFLGKKEPK